MASFAAAAYCFPCSKEKACEVSATSEELARGLLVRATVGVESTGFEGRSFSTFAEGAGVGLTRRGLVEPDCAKTMLLKLKTAPARASMHDKYFFFIRSTSFSFKNLALIPARAPSVAQYKLAMRPSSFRFAFPRATTIYFMHGNLSARLDFLNHLPVEIISL